MAEISPIFHSSGILLLCRLRLNIFSNGSNIISASSVRSLGCTLSGPGDFAVFNDSITFLILSFEIFTSFNTASNFLVGTSGISCIFPLWRMMTARQPFLYHSWCFFLPHLLQSKRGRVFLGVLPELFRVAFGLFCYASFFMLLGFLCQILDLIW